MSPAQQRNTNTRLAIMQASDRMRRLAANGDTCELCRLIPDVQRMIGDLQDQAMTGELAGCDLTCPHRRARGDS